MKQRFTPGPWNAQPGVMGGEWTLRHDPTDEVICIRANQANARLIALAPEMEAELRSVHNTLLALAVVQITQTGMVQVLIEKNLNSIKALLSRAAGDE